MSIKYRESNNKNQSNTAVTLTNRRASVSMISSYNFTFHQDDADLFDHEVSIKVKLWPAHDTLICAIVKGDKSRSLDRPIAHLHTNPREGQMIISSPEAL